MEKTTTSSLSEAWDTALHWLSASASRFLKAATYTTVRVPQRVQTLGDQPLPMASVKYIRLRIIQKASLTNWRGHGDVRIILDGDKHRRRCWELDFWRL